MAFIKYTVGKVNHVIEYFQCACFSEDHLFKVHFDEEDLQLHVVIALNNFSFWRRLKKAYRYLCGKSCEYGHFDDFILKDEDITRLKEILIEVEKKRSVAFSVEKES